MFAGLADSCARLTGALRDLFVARGSSQTDLLCLAFGAIAGRFVHAAVRDVWHADVVVDREFLTADTALAVSVCLLVVVAVVSLRHALVQVWCMFSCDQDKASVAREAVV